MFSLSLTWYIKLSGCFPKFIHSFPITSYGRVTFKINLEYILLSTVFHLRLTIFIPYFLSDFFQLNFFLWQWVPLVLVLVFFFFFFFGRQVIPKETVAAITILNRNTKVKVRSPDGDTEYFDIVAGVLQRDTLAPYLFIICLDYVLRTSIDKIRENGFKLTKKRSRRYPAKTITDADYADDIAILANTPDQAETLLHSLERAAVGIGLYVNAHKTEYMCYNQTGDISTLDGTPLKLVDKFTYLGSSVASTEKDIDTRLTKAWTAINRLSIIWKSDLTDKMKRSFFQTALTSILLYGCTTWTLTKRLEKKLDGNYTRMLRAILNKSLRQHPTRHQLYGHLPPITKTIQVRRTRHAGHCWRSRDELIRDVLWWTPIHGRAKAGRPART